MPILQLRAPRFARNPACKRRLIFLAIYAASSDRYLVALLFNRKASSTVCGREQVADPSLAAEPACPSPIAVLAWFYVSSI